MEGKMSHLPHASEIIGVHYLPGFCCDIYLYYLATRSRCYSKYGRLSRSRGTAYKEKECFLCQVPNQTVRKNTLRECNSSCMIVLSEMLRVIHLER